MDAPANNEAFMSKLKLDPDQYQSLKKFLNFFSDRFLNVQSVPPENRPIAILEAMEKTAPGRAADGLMMAINDCIEMSSGWGTEKIVVLDAELKNSGIITLTELRHQYSRQYARVVKRGRITNEEEYYLLKGILDGDSLKITDPEKESLIMMLDSYENKIKAVTRNR